MHTVAIDVLVLSCCLSFVLGMIAGVVTDIWLDNLDKEANKPCKKKRRKSS